MHTIHEFIGPDLIFFAVAYLIEQDLSEREHLGVKSFALDEIGFKRRHPFLAPAGKEKVFFLTFFPCGAKPLEPLKTFM